MRLSSRLARTPDDDNDCESIGRRPRRSQRAARVKATDQSLRLRHGELLNEHGRVWGALQTREEITANAEGLVDEFATNWPANHRAMFVSSLRFRQAMRSGSTWSDPEQETTVRPRIRIFTTC
jgi:hypothetical protein